MGVVPKPFLRPISACYYYIRKIELLKISQNIKCSKFPALAGKRSKEFFSRKMNRSI
jgi:hypothetical protein